VLLIFAATWSQNTKRSLAAGSARLRKNSACESCCNGGTCAVPRHGRLGLCRDAWWCVSVFHYYHFMIYSFFTFVCCFFTVGWMTGSVSGCCQLSPKGLFNINGRRELEESGTHKSDPRQGKPGVQWQMDARMLHRENPV